MTSWNTYKDKIEEYASRLILLDLSSRAEIDSFLKELEDFSALPDISSNDHIKIIMNSSIEIMRARDLSEQEAEGLLTLLLDTLKQALDMLSREEDISALSAGYEKKITNILSNASCCEVKELSDTQLKEIPNFTNNAASILDDIEKALLLLEKNPDNTSAVDSIFRGVHTIKGEANMLGLTNLGALAHAIENLLGDIRNKTTSVDAETTGIFLKVIDALRELLAKASSDPMGASCENIEHLLNEVELFREDRKNNSAATQEVPAPDNVPDNELEEKPFISQVPELDLSMGIEIYVEFVAEGDDHLNKAEEQILVLETRPTDKEAVDSIFRAFHTIKGAAGFLELRDIREFSHHAETMLDMVRKNILSFSGRVVELTLVSVDVLRKLLQLLGEQTANDGKIKGEYPDIAVAIEDIKTVIRSNENKKPIGEILIEEGAVTDEELEDALKEQKEVCPDARLGEILKSKHAVSDKQIDSALKIQKTGVPAEHSIKIKLDKLDALIDTVGELVISETQVVQNPLLARIDDRRFQRNISELDRITRSLQHIAMGMRLVPIGPTFQKMVRLVRDFSKRSGKEASIYLNGEETEIDKNMVEYVGDPIMHMIRNSLDHGIEPKETRIARGKSPTGKIHLSAYHKGSFVVIEIKDDGGGLNKEKILKKAVERGIVKENEKIPEDRIFNLIFEPGFSTADKVTDVSGRGVGMDVVKRNIEKLRGRIDIMSEEGKGSVFAINLPITLAIIEAIVARVGREKYILPTNSVSEFLKPQKEKRTRLYDGKDMYSAHGRVLPLMSLSCLFGVPDDKKDFEETTICLIESEQGEACVIVDEIIGQQQVVIKSLGEKLHDIPGVSGGAILGDGHVGLIIDTNSLMELFLKKGVDSWTSE